MSPPIPCYSKRVGHEELFITKEGAVGEKITELYYWKAGVLPRASEDYRKKHYSYIKFIFQQIFKGQTIK